MNDTDAVARRALLCFAIFLAFLAAATIIGGAMPQPATAADDVKPAAAPADAGTEPSAAEPKMEVKKEIDILRLLFRGGWLMVPIAAMSLLVVTFGTERFLGLRRRKVLPPELIGELGQQSAQKGGLDPRKAFKICQQHPSAAATVIKTMLLKVGRPHSELEHTVSEASQREADRLYANVRWLSLAAGVSPLLGLLGTVWGMIMAFFKTTTLAKDVDRATQLADGIYMALVTTFAGLAVAIPAAILAHWFEGRIQSLFREMDETVLGMMPQLERFEGRMRVGKEATSGSAAESAPPEVPPAEVPLAKPQPQQSPAPAE